MTPNEYIKLKHNFQTIEDARWVAFKAGQASLKQDLEFAYNTLSGLKHTVYTKQMREALLRLQDVLNTLD